MIYIVYTLIFRAAFDFNDWVAGKFFLKKLGANKYITYLPPHFHLKNKKK